MGDNNRGFLVNNTRCIHRIKPRPAVIYEAFGEYPCRIALSKNSLWPRYAGDLWKFKLIEWDQRSVRYPGVLVRRWLCPLGNPIFKSNEHRSLVIKIGIG